jgi:hypothetical protein
VGADGGRLAGEPLSLLGEGRTEAGDHEHPVAHFLENYLECPGTLLGK